MIFGLKTNNCNYWSLIRSNIIFLQSLCFLELISFSFLFNNDTVLYKVTIMNNWIHF